MKVTVTPSIATLLREAAGEGELPEDVQDEVCSCAGQEAIEWDALKRIAAAVQQRRGGDGPSLHELCRGGGLALAPPPPRSSGKSPELQAHLDRLRVRLEQQKYDSMVSDVTEGERAAAAAAEGGFVTYKQQISFGIHVIAMMGAFYAFGHLAGMAITPNKAYHPAVGLAFMVFVMILETVLFVIRTTVPPRLHSEVAERAARRRAALAAASAAAAADSGPPAVPEDTRQSLAEKKAN